MKMNRLTIAALCLICAGCAIPRGVVTPLENVVVDNKHALTIAGEQMLFEEFVKFKLLKSTFNLYAISKASIEVDTTEQVTDTAAANVTLPLVLTKGVGVSNTYAANSGDTGKLTIELVPIASSPAVYNKIIEKFTVAPDTIFGLTSRDDRDFSAKCTTEAYCFMMPNDHGQFAYLRDIQQLRALENEIRQLAPPPAPAGSADPKSKT